MSLETKPKPALSPREAASDDECGVFESLLEDPILSFTTGDEITIVDEGSGLEDREEAEEVDSEENSEAEVEPSEEHSDTLEEDNNNEYDKSKAVESIDPKTLPFDHKCGSQGFQGCDSKCQVEDLTPYQNSKRCMGEYLCVKCKSRWQSASSNANRSQRCPDCGQDIYPHWQRPLDDWEASAVSGASHSGHHDTCLGSLNKGKRTSLKKRRAVTRKTNLKMRIVR